MESDVNLREESALMPRVSVCIDCYNYAEFLPQAIESALSQTFRDLEIIVVDDASTDDSHAVALRYARQDPRLRVQRNAVNLGMVKNRNVCLQLARGEFIKFIHADDFFADPTSLERLVARIEKNPATSLVACAMRFVDATGQDVGESARHFNGERMLAGSTVTQRCLVEQKNLVGGPSAVMFRRSLAQRGFDETYFHAADLEMWLHLLEQGCFSFEPEALVGYRWHPKQQTQKDRATLTQANDQRALLSRYLDRPYLRLRPWMKNFLRHEAVRQTRSRARRIGPAAADQAASALHEFGGLTRYALYWPWCLAWKKVPGLARTIQQRIQPYYATNAPIKLPAAPLGINVAGFFKGQFGIGESSRAFCRAIAESNVPHSFLNIHSRVHDNADTSVAGLSADNPYGINLMTFSFDYSRRFFLDQKKRFFAGRHNIALWYWELEKFPARWHSNFDYYDEIWTPTEFCRAALAAVSPVPVRKMTYPFYSAASVPADRAGLGLPADRCLFLFNFDFCSTVARKNPLAVIAAFRQAFTASEAATLVLKSINSHRDPAGRQLVAEALRGLNVVWLEQHLNSAQMAALFASVDCYVSLHRSEGLGLGMAQAMAAGKPVIATGYSGNLEFMNEHNSRLVKFKTIEIKESVATYDAGNFWADPDVEDAARQLRWIFENRAASQSLGQRAAQDLAATLSPAKAQAEIRRRVDEIYLRG